MKITYLLLIENSRKGHTIVFEVTEFKFDIYFKLTDFER